ncbi:MAG: pyruvate kinase [Dehalococcoidia bacterium]|nr:pyruvate kinase [Dehalococcoidia bacterium]
MSEKRSSTLVRRRTKIVATIGPATASIDMLRKLIAAGMDVARLNFAHGSYEQHAASIQAIRQAAVACGKPVAILQDLPGPKVRTGKLTSESVMLEDGATLVLTTADTVGDAARISISLPSLPKAVKTGSTIYLDDGSISLEVLGASADEIQCRVLVGGKLGWEKGINVPGVRLDVPALTEQDIKHLDFGLLQGVDLVALSFVRDAEDIRKLKKLLDEKGANVPVIAKIEKHEAMDSIDEILEVADGAMVARGDLGIEIPIAEVPLAQKKIIRKCNHLGKPVIVATQMLESMVEYSRPTRAEATDVANAIFDGADALMLSEETAIGRYPVEAVKMMSQIAVQTETALPYETILREMGLDPAPNLDDAISYAACRTAHQLNASAIIAFTTSGSTARRVSRYRPRVPILGMTSSEATLRQLNLSWGVYPILAPQCTSLDDLLQSGVDIAQTAGLIQKGDLVVMVAGVPIGVAGTTNMLRVQKVE